jgi:hypothetical protein
VARVISMMEAEKQKARDKKQLSRINKPKTMSRRLWESISGLFAGGAAQPTGGEGARPTIQYPTRSKD